MYAIQCRVLKFQRILVVTLHVSLLFFLYVSESDVYLSRMCRMQRLFSCLVERLSPPMYVLHDISAADVFVNLQSNL